MSFASQVPGFSNIGVDVGIVEIGDDAAVHLRFGEGILHFAILAERETEKDAENLDCHDAGDAELMTRSARGTQSKRSMSYSLVIST